MDNDTSIDRTELLALTAGIVSAYVANNAAAAGSVPDLIGMVFAKLSALSSGEAPLPETLVPAVPVKRSVTEDYLVCLEDGRKLKMLRRHLMVAWGMTPDEYRTKWGLKPDYPMVAPALAAKRKAIAKQIGLGRKRETVVSAPAPAKPRGRKKAAA